MKKFCLLLILFAAFGLLSFFVGCGGGGAVNTVPVVQNSPTPFATATAVASTTPTSNVGVTGKVVDLFSGVPVSGASVALGNSIVATDSQGNFQLGGTNKGRMIVSGNGFFERSYLFTGGSIANIAVVGTDFNNLAYSGYLIRNASKRWLRVPKVIINNNFESAITDAIKNVITNEIPGLSGDYLKINDVLTSSSATEPAEGEVLIIIDNSVSQSSTELSYSGNEIVAVKIVYRYQDLQLLSNYSLRVIRHELGHMIGFGHPFEVLGWSSPDLQVSVMNYVTAENKWSFAYTDFDKLAGKRFYSRGAGNQLPDYDPDTPLGKQKVEKIKI